MRWSKYSKSSKSEEYNKMMCSKSYDSLDFVAVILIAVNK